LFLDDVNPICTRVVLEPCKKLKKLVKMWNRKRLKFQFGQYGGNVNISCYRNLIDVILKRN